MQNIQTRTADKPSKKKVFEVALSISGSRLVLYWGHKTCSSSPLQLPPHNTNSPQVSPTTAVTPSVSCRIFSATRSATFWKKWISQHIATGERMQEERRKDAVPYKIILVYIYVYNVYVPFVCLFSVLCRQEGTVWWPWRQPDGPPIPLRQPDQSDHSWTESRLQVMLLMLMMMLMMVLITLDIPPRTLLLATVSPRSWSCKLKINKYLFCLGENDEPNKGVGWCYKIKLPTW